MAISAILITTTNLPQSFINIRTSTTISSIFLKENIIINFKFKNYQRIAATLKESFITDYTPSTDEFQVEGKVEKIKKILANKSRKYGDDNVEVLVMIDAIQRLGLEYYFRDEIEEALEKYYSNFSSNAMGGVGNNLYDVAFRFRMLRQQGYYVSADALQKFKDKNGTFKQELAKDIKGLMSLFEASQLSTQDDYILDEALEFSQNHLMASLKNSAQQEAMIIGNILRYPYHKSLPRLMAENILSIFKTSLKVLHDSNNINDWVNQVQDLANFDMNMTQISQKLEVTQVSRWWKELKVAEHLKVARVNPAKWHMWSMALLPAPHMSEQRIELTKSLSLVYIIDDIYDVCATIDELTLFTQAINRWELANMEGLPEYMQLCLKAIYELTDEQSQKIYIKHGWNPKEYIKNAWVNLCNAWLMEAKWISSGQLPNTEDYLKTGIVTSGVDVGFVYVVSLLGEKMYGTSNNYFQNYPKIVSSTSTIFRLWDDLGTAKDEDQDGRDGSFILCYMNENKGISSQSAREYVLKRISDAWKVLNKECLTDFSFSTDFKKACLNMARIVPMMHNYDGMSQLSPMIN